MKKLRNWDNKTWLSSKSYISQFNKFLKSKINLNKNLKILDIGCGRANIISKLAKKYNFKVKPTGIDVLKHQDVKRNVRFIKTHALNFLKRAEKFDLIIIKQTIHLMSKKNQFLLLKMCKN